MVRFRFLPVLPVAAALLLALPVPAQQQSSGSAQQPAPQKKQDKQDKKDKKDKKDQDKSAAQQNAFPEAESRQAAQQGQQQNPPSAPAPSTQPKQGKSEADQNPFPEAESENAAKQAQQRQNAAQNAAPNNQNSGSSPDSSSSVIPGLNLPTNAGKLPPGAAPGPNPSLGRQDTRVGNFYLQSGDWKGAYSRFLEATQVDPADADAVFGLAESARHLGNNKIAIQNYKLYLSALPSGKHARDCRKALKDLGVKP